MYFSTELAFQCLSSPSNEWAAGRCRGISSHASRRRCDGLEIPAGLVRNLVMLESGGRKRIVHREELLLADLFVHGAELAPCRTAAEGRIGFDGQMYAEMVLYAERQHSVERSFQRIPAEAGNAEDQVGGDVPEPGALCRPHRTDGLCRRMAAVHQLQAPVVERLDADRQPVYARFAQPVEVIFRQVVGVGLEGGFRGAGAVEQQRGMIQQSFQRGGCVERRACRRRNSGS